jgi:hypothetical protein
VAAFAEDVLAGFFTVAAVGVLAVGDTGGRATTGSITSVFG